MILQTKIQTMQNDHNRELAAMQARHVTETVNMKKQYEKDSSFLQSVGRKALTWFPRFREMLCMDELCRKVGFNDEQTATLIKGKLLKYSGELYSEEHNCQFPVERVTAQITPDPTDKRKLQLNIDKIPFKVWCNNQFTTLQRIINQRQIVCKGFKL